MKKLVLLLVLIISFNAESGPNDFNNYISSLDTIPLPYKFDSYCKLSMITKEYDTTAFELYSDPNTVYPLGLLYQYDDGFIVLECVISDNGPVPWFVNYDIDGKIKETTNFFDKSGNYFEYAIYEYITISEDLYIEVLDSAKTWELLDDGTYLEKDTLQTTNGKTYYQIEKDGKIIEANQSR